MRINIGKKIGGGALALLLAAVLLVSGVMPALAATGFIGVEKAKSIALKDAGVKAESAKFTSSKLDKDKGIDIYDVEFYTSTKKYEYDINASTGKIIEASKKNRAGTSSAKSTSQSAKKGIINTARAKQIALKDAGVSESSANFSEASLEKDDGAYRYEIEFYTSVKRYEYEIDAYSGKILKKGSKARAGVSSGAKEEVAKNIGEVEAKKIAANNAGYSIDDVKNLSVRLTFKDTNVVDRVQVYKVEFDARGVDYEYIIDAKTGSIVEFELDE